MNMISLREQSDFPEAEDLIKLYKSNIFKIAKILKVRDDDIPRGIVLSFEEGDGAAYRREEKKLVYRYKIGEILLKDKGRLIHEAAHVVQDYQFDLIAGSAICCWTEGIADFCRLKLDIEFADKVTLICNPEEGYGNAASFLDWLSIDHPSIVPDLNKMIHDMGLELHGHDSIFMKLLKTRFNDLKRKCIYEKSEKLG
jgi:Peptidase of plants and bacteria